jgi:hypothetical protein
MKKRDPSPLEEGYKRGTRKWRGFPVPVADEKTRSLSSRRGIQESVQMVLGIWIPFEF